MTDPSLTACRCEAGLETRTIIRKVVDIAEDSKRLIVNLPRTTKNCCENSGGGREKSRVKLMNSWLFL
jgi:hypothetical protein